jgi:hypothetical protein
MIKLYENKEPGDNGLAWLVAIITIVCLILATSKCHAADNAQVDTMVCKSECIQKIVQQTSAKGTVHYYAVYKDQSINFSEVIPISKSVVEYIETCKQYSLKPTLGIRLRNGVVSSIVRYKIKFVKRK